MPASPKGPRQFPEVHCLEPTLPAEKVSMGTTAHPAFTFLPAGGNALIRALVPGPEGT